MLRTEKVKVITEGQMLKFGLKQFIRTLMEKFEINLAQNIYNKIFMTKSTNDTLPQNHPNSADIPPSLAETHQICLKIICS